MPRTKANTTPRRTWAVDCRSINPCRTQCRVKRAAPRRSTWSNASVQCCSRVSTDPHGHRPSRQSLRPRRRSTAPVLPPARHRTRRSIAVRAPIERTSRTPSRLRLFGQLRPLQRAFHAAVGAALMIASILARACSLVPFDPAEPDRKRADLDPAFIRTSNPTGERATCSGTRSRAREHLSISRREAGCDRRYRGLRGARVSGAERSKGARAVVGLRRDVSGAPLGGRVPRRWEVARRGEIRGGPAVLGLGGWEHVLQWLEDYLEKAIASGL